MSWSLRGILIRGASMLVLCCGVLWVMYPYMMTTRTRLQTSVDLKEEGVSIKGGREGMVVVRVDDREETVASSELESSELYREAMQRIGDAAAARIGERYEAWSWWRFSRNFVPFAVLFYIFLFVVWKPSNPNRYVEGSA